MAVRLDIGGNIVEVDDHFLKLSEAEQQKTVNEIARQIQGPAGIELPPGSVPAAPPPPPPEFVDPNAGSFADSVGKGLTFGFSDELAGLAGASVNSIAGLFGGGTGESFGEAYKGTRDAARYNEENFAKRNPTAALAGEVGGGLLTGGLGAARVGALKGGQSLGKLAAVGGTEGAIQGAGYSDADLLQGDIGGLLGDTATGGALGAGLGAAAPKLLGAVGSGAQRAAKATGVDEAYKAAADRLRKAGVSLTTGQQVGSEGVKSVERRLSNTFVGGGAVRDTLEGQHRQLQGRLMGMAGFDAQDVQTGTLTEEAIDRARKKFGQAYDEALKGKQVNIADDKFIDEIADIETQFQRLTSTQQKKQVADIMNDLLDEASQGPLSGQQYQSLRSFVGKKSRNLMVGDPDNAQLYGKIQRALDNAFERSTGTTNKALNTKYAQFTQLAKAYENSGSVSAAEGLVPLASLNRAARKKKNPSSPEWRQLINDGQKVLGSTTPNSGTPGGVVDIGAAASAAGTGGLSVAAPFIAGQLLGRGVGSSTARAAQGATQGLLKSGGARLSQAAPAGLLAAPAAHFGVDPAQEMLQGLLR